MRKRYLFSLVVGIGALTYFFQNERAKTTMKNWIQMFQMEESFPIEEAGLPETDAIENAKMVDEGSQFGVNYYNHLKERE